MTHDVLEKINKDINQSPWTETYYPFKALVALRSVVELHTSVLTGKKNRGKAGLSKRCTECGFAYPCPTIQIIERELA